LNNGELDPTVTHNSLLFNYSTTEAKYFIKIAIINKNYSGHPVLRYLLLA
jgi:hypothetical protein